MSYKYADSKLKTKVNLLKNNLKLKLFIINKWKIELLILMFQNISFVEKEVKM